MLSNERAKHKKSNKINFFFATGNADSQLFVNFIDTARSDWESGMFSVEPRNG